MYKVCMYVCMYSGIANDIVHNNIHTWLHPMQVFISSALPCFAFRTNCGSARKGRAMLMRSAEPLANIDSAVCAVETEEFGRMMDWK